MGQRTRRKKFAGDASRARHYMKRVASFDFTSDRSADNTTQGVAVRKTVSSARVSVRRDSPGTPRGKPRARREKKRDEAEESLGRK